MKIQLILTLLNMASRNYGIGNMLNVFFMGLCSLLSDQAVVSLIFPVLCLNPNDVVACMVVNYLSSIKSLESISASYWTFSFFSS